MFEGKTKLSKESKMILSGLIVLIFAGSGIIADGRDERSLTSTNRPMRDRRHLVLTVGQNEGIRIGEEAERVVLRNNTFEGCPAPRE